MSENIQTLRKTLKEARDAYYNGEGIMPDREYDRLASELKQLDTEAGYVDDTEINAVGADPAIKGLAKVKHEYPALSLNKTHNVDDLVAVFPKESVLMWKLDGLTAQLTYENGKISVAATRGNGEIGQDITAKIKYIHGIPESIPETGKLVVRGEVLMGYTEFQRINNLMGGIYENPRNLASGTLASDETVMAERQLDFKAFSLVHFDAKNQDHSAMLHSGITLDTFSGRLENLKALGFAVTDYAMCHRPDELRAAIQTFTDNAETYDFPVDGLVAADEDALGTDGLADANKYPNIRKGYALKWKDETAETTLRDIEWSASRTGLINPVAVFDEVRLEGTKVCRASLHNINYMEYLNLAIGDRISVYKANKIIPQIAENLSHDDHAFCAVKPIICPVCGCIADIDSTRHGDHIVKTMWCKNPDCVAKKIGKFTHFGERDCMNILGTSDATVSKMVNHGMLHEFADFYRFAESDEMQKQMASWDKSGEKAVANMVSAIKNSAKNVDFVSFIHALGIPNVGKGQAKLMKPVFESEFNGNIQTFMKNIGTYDWSHIDGLGPVRNRSIHIWADKYTKAITDEYDGHSRTGLEPEGYYEIYDLLECLDFAKPEIKSANSQPFAGKTFVVTGAVMHFENRDAIHAFIEANGGKTSGSVSAKTSYLVNNDVTSESGKNKKAKELGIPVISEDTLLQMVKGE